MTLNWPAAHRGHISEWFTRPHCCHLAMSWSRRHCYQARVVCFTGEGYCAYFQKGTSPGCGRCFIYNQAWFTSRQRHRWLMKELLPWLLLRLLSGAVGVMEHALSALPMTSWRWLECLTATVSKPEDLDSRSHQVCRSCRGPRFMINYCRGCSASKRRLV